MDSNKRNRAVGDELNRFVIQGSPVDNELTKFDLNDQGNHVETGMSVMDELLNERIDGQISMVAVKSRDKTAKKPAIYTLVNFSYDEDVELQILNQRSSNKLTAYDKRILNAIGTLFLSDKHVFSLTEVYCVANAYTNKRPAKKQLESVEKSIRKLSKINMFLDITSEVEGNNFPDTQVLKDANMLVSSGDKLHGFKFEGRLLPIQICTITSEKGQRSVSIKLETEPLLVTYNRAKRTLFTIPMEYMRSKDVNFSDRSIAIQDYLIKRLYGYGKGYLTQNKILYKTILSECGFSDGSKEGSSSKIRNQKMRDRDMIQKMFEHWKISGLVDNYCEIINNSGQFEGVEFIMTRKISDDLERPRAIPAIDDSSAK